MKRVIFEVAKTLKKAGFHEKTAHFYSDTYDDEDNPTHQFELCGASIPSYVQDWNDTNKYPEYNEVHVNYWNNKWSAPEYLKVWLWLWREKKIKIDIDNCINKCAIFDSTQEVIYSRTFTDPEEAIIEAIEYLVTNDLIK